MTSPTFITTLLPRIPVVARMAGATCAVALVLAGTANLGAQAPDRSKPPATGTAPALNIPAIQKHTLSNGLPVWIVEMHEVPVVDVNLIVKSGAASDLTGKFGVANFTACLLYTSPSPRD